MDRLFSRKGCLSDIACPLDAKCQEPNCWFAHPEDPAQSPRHRLTKQDAAAQDDAPRKRRKIDTDETSTTGQDAQAQKPVHASALPTPPGEASDGDVKDASPKSLAPAARRPPIQKEISPPPLKRTQPRPSRSSTVTRTSTSKAPEESLNPRILPHPPASHATRLLYLQKLHEFMERLNQKAGLSKEPDMQDLKMTSSQLISAALDEEEKIARENPAVYANVIKLRMVALSKMTLDQWKIVRLEARSKQDATKTQQDGGGEKLLQTELTGVQEIRILRELLSDPQKLGQFGLVTSPPSTDEISAALKGVEASMGWEQCERCKSRFQVFPERRSDGALTSGGKCTYHHGRILFPERRSVDGAPGLRDKTYSCCNEPIGASLGCTTAQNHVYKIQDKKRLASILQFETTPENANVPDDRAVSFDCEMGYTVNGMELIRLTAISWPEGDELLDVLVRPLGTIIDLNTRYSGVRVEDFSNALPYNRAESLDVNDSEIKSSLRVVDSPMAARSLLFELISPSTPLIAHAIENDLNAARIVHPSIIDTVLLYPHKNGLPQRRALKTLASQMLWRNIQQGGVAGHDSKEDAKAAGDLVLLTVRRKWNQMKQQGWSFQAGQLSCPSNPAGSSPKVSGTTKA